MTDRTYIFLSPDDLLEVVYVGRLQGWEIGLAILEKEVIELSLTLKLALELIHVDLLEILAHLCSFLFYINIKFWRFRMMLILTREI